MSKMQAKGDAASLLISATDLAREFRISTRTVRRLDLQGKIPRPIRVGRRAVRWRRAEVVDWAAAGGPSRDEWNWKPEGRYRHAGPPGSKAAAG